MIIQEKSRAEVEAKLGMMSDFLKMEYMENCIKQHRDFEIKKFCHQKLADLYAGRNMFLEAARNASSAAELAATFKEKIGAYMKEVELWIRAGQFDRADEAFRKALVTGNTQEKFEMKRKIIELYREQARFYEKSGKQTHALKVYQRLIEMLGDEQEKYEVKKRMLELYKRLGKIREYSVLSAQLEGRSL
jgi:tetratricopeptide (TPR) repeat protein